jgi:hypothetical protein
VSSCHLPKIKSGLFVVIAAAIWIAPAVVFPSSLAAQESSELELVSTAEYKFGQIMEFSLTVIGETEVKKVSLFISAPELRRTLTTEVAVEAGDDLVANYSLDLRTVRLAPFTRVTYWWEGVDATGTKFMSPESSIEYADNQFDWETLEKDGVRFNTTAADSSLGEPAMDIVSETLRRLRTIIPVEVPVPLNIYMYPSESDLRAALRLTGREWIGSHAHPELGVVLVPAPDKDTVTGALERTLPHELSHLLLFQAVGDAYPDIPRWFDEGLATSLEGTDVVREDLVRESIASGSSIPFADLCHSFPEDAGQFSLAYAQSASLIEYIGARYGGRALTDMVRALAEGAECRDLTQQALGVSLEELEDDWLRHQAPESVLMRIWRQGAVILLIALAFLLMVLLLVVRSPRRSGE